MERNTTGVCPECGVEFEREKVAEEIEKYLQPKEKIWSYFLSSIGVILLGWVLLIPTAGISFFIGSFVAVIMLTLNTGRGVRGLIYQRAVKADDAGRWIQYGRRYLMCCLVWIMLSVLFGWVLPGMIFFWMILMTGA